MNTVQQKFAGSAARVFAAGIFAAALTLGAGTAIAAQAKAVDRVEMRINDMHAKLHITPDQETQWQQVAQAMRDNESTIQPLIEDRKQNARTMSAIDDLHSYQAITEAHLQGIKKLTPAFETLYASLSDTQKKEADALFRGKMEKKHSAK